MVSSAVPPRRVGRYLLCGEIASGGMATVYFGRLLGPLGFSRAVALKRLHPAYVKDPTFVAMLLDEARLASRVRHPNVVQVLDIVTTKGELILVMEYVQGMAVSKLMEIVRRTGSPPPPAVASAVIADVLRALHAAHEARTETGQPLELIHRDISPQNILVHQEGMTLVTDFGIARATGRLQKTREGELKGKPAYMAPEQLKGEQITRRVDEFATGIVLWEMLTGQRLFGAESELESVRKVIAGPIERPSRVRPEIPEAVDEVVLRALARDPAQRYPTTAEMQLALEQALPPAPTSAVAAWVQSLAGETLLARAREIQRIESAPADELPPEEEAATDESAAPALPLPAQEPASPAKEAAPPPQKPSSPPKKPPPRQKPASPAQAPAEPVATAAEEEAIVTEEEVEESADPAAAPSSRDLAELVAAPPSQDMAEPAAAPPSQEIAEPTAVTPPPLRKKASHRKGLRRAALVGALVGGLGGLGLLAAGGTKQAPQPASAGLSRAVAVLMLSGAAAEAFVQPAPPPEPPPPAPEPAASASAESPPAPAPSAKAPAKPRTKTKSTTKTKR